ncbi:ATP-binding protein [Metapseudomonas otitidis]
MLKRRALALLALLALLAGPGWHAPAGATPPLDLAQLAELGAGLPEHPVRVAVVRPISQWPQYPGSAMLRGITHDYLARVGAFVGRSIEEVPFPSVEAAIRGLKAGEVDLLTRVTGYERREPGLAYSRPYLDDTPIIVGRRDDPCLPPDLADKRVLVLAQYLDPEQVRNAYPAAHLETVRSTAEGFDQVLSGEADAFIGDKLRVDHHMRARPGAALQNKFAANLSSGGFSFASRADDTRLLTLVDYVLGTLDEHQRETILAHWTAAPRLFSPTGAFALDSAQERWLDQQPRLRLILAEAPPYFFRDARGKWSGLGLELLKQLGDTYQLKLELLDSEGAARDRQRLARGEADLASTLDGSASPGVFYTEPFGARGWAFVVRQDASSPSSLEAMTGRRLALPRHHPLIDYLEKRYPAITLVRTENAPQAMERVRLGEVDASLDNLGGSPSHLQWLERQGLRLGQRVEAASPAQMLAVSGQVPELRGILDKLLGSLAQSGEFGDGIKLLAAPANGWLERLPEDFWHLSILALVVVALSLLWNWRLRREIRQRREAQEQLSDQLAFQFSLLNGLPTPLYVRDLQGRLSTCNRAYEQFFGCDLEQLRGTTVRQQGIAPASLAQAMEAEYQLLQQNRQPRFFDGRIEIDGREHDLYQWVVPFYSAGGQLQGLLGGWIDISDRKALETELREARRDALQASAAKGRFLATMSHELRTPLNALVGLLELEARAQAAPSENLRIAQQSATSMIALIGNILDLDRIENGRMQLALEPVAPLPLLRGALDLFGAQARSKGLELELDCKLPADRRYRLDPLRLRQVLFNLLGNAVKFTAHGRVRLVARVKDTAPGQSRLVLMVSDTGIGIPRHMQDRILEPYQQGGAQTARHYGGSGLGLSICHHLVGLMGGRLWLESEPGQGCEVGVELPAAWEAAAEPLEAPVVEATGATRVLRALVVDDLSINGLVLVQQLEALGHQARFVGDGDSALAALEEETFDLLITDCNMPDMDGYALTGAVRDREAEGQRPRLRIVGYTASALADEAQRCHEAGMDDLMVKPVTLGRLAEALACQAQAEHDGEAPTEQPGALFDLGHLEGIRGADPTLLATLMEELQRNLGDELERLGQIPDGTSTERYVAQTAHRLGGLACTIDSPALMKACEGLRRAEDEHRPAALDALRGVLQALLEQVRQRTA